MKILFLVPDMSQYAARLHHQWLEDEMFKIADCKTAGLGRPDYKRERVQATIDRLYDGDSPDWVIINITSHDRYWNNYKAPERRDWKIACFGSDIHDNRTKKPDQAFLKKRNNNNVDAVLMRCMKIKWDGDPDFIVKHLKPKAFHLPFHINPKIVKPSKKPKVWDITNLGATGNAYPLRQAIHKKLPQLCRRLGLKHLSTSWPPGDTGLFIPRLKKDPKWKFYVGQEYYDAISRSKMMIFDGGWARYAVQKYFECGFLKTLMLADTPMDAETLHLEPGWNFVNITRANWEAELQYYLKHENDRLEIVENAYETMMQHHTSEIRAQQFLDFLEENR